MQTSDRVGARPGSGRREVQPRACCKVGRGMRSATREYVLTTKAVFRGASAFVPGQALIG